jgi:photoactive yellow protein
MSFVSESVLSRLGDLKLEEANELPFGVIQLDDEGNIILYNRYESELSKLSANDVIGKNFFQIVAPCTNNRLFKGKFDYGIAHNALDDEFLYTFTYRLRPTNVAVHLYRDNNSNTNWIFIQKR